MSDALPPLYRDPDRYDAIAGTVDDDLPWWRDSLRPWGRRVLECGSGTGRLALALAADGYALWGLEPAEPMRRAAVAKAGALPRDSRPRFVDADFRDAALGITVDAVIIANNTLGHCHTSRDLAGLCRTAQRHLRPGGAFCIDYFNPDPAILADPGGDELLTYPDPQTGRPITLRERRQFDAATRLLRTTWQHDDEHGRTLSDDPMTLRIWFPDELDQRLQTNGFTIRSKHGDYDGTAFRSDSLLQLITATAS